MSTNAKYQLDALRSVRRQFEEDILPDSRRAVQKLIASGVPPVNPQDVAGALLDRLDDITSTGRLPLPPSPSDVIKTITEESKNLFLSTPELETPDYKVSAISRTHTLPSFDAGRVC